MIRGTWFGADRDAVSALVRGREWTRTSGIWRVVPNTHGMALWHPSAEHPLAYHVAGGGIEIFRQSRMHYALLRLYTGLCAVLDMEGRIVESQHDILLDGAPLPFVPVVLAGPIIAMAARFALLPNDPEGDREDAEP